MADRTKAEKATDAKARQSKKGRDHELAMAKLKAENDLARDIVKYVGEDIQSQLLIVALTGTSIATAIAMYKAAEADNRALPPAQQIAFPPLWQWVIMGPAGIGGAIVSTVGTTMDSMFDTNVMGSATTPWGVISQMQAGAKDTAALAWTALFTSLIMGKGGLGAVMKDAGGGTGAGMLAMMGA